ncbi:lipoyl synthase [Candidatus Aerophobetes bacterium]|nr:lipoyl synthase [Candidatus Aerophobetes bacterium]
MKLPSWLTKRVSSFEVIEEMEHLLHSFSVHTVCQEARCPNIGECFSQRTAAFMILGDVCTRNCYFCAVKKGKPLFPDMEEPERIAQVVAKLDLRYVVITSVTRDDLPDGGARQFAGTITAIKKLCGEKTFVEVLIPDFCGSLSSLQEVLQAKPLVLNHNLETVPALYTEVRPEADYQRSLQLLKECKRIYPKIYTKSGLMVGLGEKKDEVVQVMQDLRNVDCDILTIGQYLRPSPEHLEVKEFIPPATFEWYEKVAYSLRFLYVASSPFVRSSYMAKNWLKSLT